MVILIKDKCIQLMMTPLHQIFFYLLSHVSFPISNPERGEFNPAGHSQALSQPYLRKAWKHALKYVKKYVIWCHRLGPNRIVFPTFNLFVWCSKEAMTYVFSSQLECIGGKINSYYIYLSPYPYLYKLPFMSNCILFKVFRNISLV